MRGEWDMSFAESGQKALDIMGKVSFDVVVTDMRMPGMNGIQLLTEVMNRQPQAVRIILSGEFDENSNMKSVKVCHQSLSKPCNAEILKLTIARTCALFDLMADDSLKMLVSQMSSLPSLPSLYAEIMEELQSEDSSTRKVGEIIEKDAGMTAKILQLVNSAFFGLPQNISSPAEAATFLGTDTIKSLVLSFQVFSQFDLKKVTKPFLDSLWSHNMITGTLAKAVAKAEDQERIIIDSSFMAGLLHDCGKLVLVSHFPERYSEFVSRWRKDDAPIWEGEREMFGVTHAEVGAYLMGLWGLPVSIVESLAFHHWPGRSMGKHFSALTAVHIANILAHDNQIKEGEGKISGVDYEYLSDLKLSDRIPAWIKIYKAVIQGDEDDG